MISGNVPEIKNLTNVMEFLTGDKSLGVFLMEKSELRILVLESK